jgi:hypothetical protein
MNARKDGKGSNGWQCGECGGRRSGSREDELVGFAAVRIDADGPTSEELIAPEDILFAFTRGAIPAPPGGRRKPVIWAPWTAEFSFAQATVYLRTRNGIYRSYVRTLEEFKRKVPGVQFRSVGQSVVANLKKLHTVGLLRQQPPTLTYSVGESELGYLLETVVVGRAYVAGIRSCFAMPARA